MIVAHDRRPKIVTFVPMGRTGMGLLCPAGTL